MSNTTPGASAEGVRAQVEGERFREGFTTDLEWLIAEHVRRINRVIASGMHEGDALRDAADAILSLFHGSSQDSGATDAASTALCEDCPPEGYPTDKTRCTPCPRRAGLNGWRTIDSAPRDGTRVLCANPEPMLPEIMRWTDRFGWWADCETYRDPTHWMPLPEPPSRNAPSGVTPGQLRTKGLTSDGSGA